MTSDGHRLGKETRARIRLEIGILFASQEGRKSILFFGLLIALLVTINGLNVLTSYVGRDFISAIENRNHTRFTREAWLYVGVFGLSTMAAVLYHYLEERLALLWRSQQTRRLIDRYLARRAYYRIEIEGELQNPDQRIADDVRAFTTTTLSFVLMTLNATFTVFAFSGVLWSISPLLFLVAVAYAACGSILAALLGKPLIGLNVRQLDKEANLRSELMHVRENAESIALLHREGQLHRRLRDRFEQLVANTRRMISVNRKLGFFTNGYNYLIQIIPALFVAPMFMRGDVQFGVVTQSATAFAYLMGAFSLLITQFQTISSYAAVVARLGKLMDAIDRADEPTSSSLAVQMTGERLVYDHLTLRQPDGTLLLHDLNIAIERGTRVLIRSASGYAKTALFKATAALSADGEGTIIRPDADAMLFVPERPYLPKSTARELLQQLPRRRSLDKTEIHAVLQALQLEAVVADSGGLDVVHDWTTWVGLSEQARFIIGRVLLAQPAFVFLDRLRAAMDPTDAEQVLKLLSERGISYLMLGKPDDPRTYFDAALDIAADGTWTWQLFTQPPRAVPALSASGV